MKTPLTSEPQGLDISGVFCYKPVIYEDFLSRILFLSFGLKTEKCKFSNPKVCKQIFLPPSTSAAAPKDRYNGKLYSLAESIVWLCINGHNAYDKLVDKTAGLCYA